MRKGVDEEADDVVHAPFAIVVAEGELDVGDIYGAVKEEVYKSCTLLWV